MSCTVAPQSCEGVKLNMPIPMAQCIVSHRPMPDWYHIHSLILVSSVVISAVTAALQQREYRGAVVRALLKAATCM